MSSEPQIAPDSHQRPVMNGRAATGVPGLDYILGGGLSSKRIYLIEGPPGSGKTTLGLQFLLEGGRNGETGLCISLSESREELRLVARSHGWKLDGIDFYELEKLENQFNPETQYTVFYPSEVELSHTVNQIRRRIAELKPSRVVFDSLSELRLISEDALRFRREILGIKQFLQDYDCTTLMLDDTGNGTRDQQIRSIVHGVVLLERLNTEYGIPQRRLCVVKMRGLKFYEGCHNFSILTGGLQVYPRLMGPPKPRPPRSERFCSGISELDQLLGGGIDRGTSTVIIGPAGCGKSTLASIYAFRAAQQGERAACYLFEESPETFLARAKSFGMELQQYSDEDRLLIQAVDPAEMSSGEFAHKVSEQVIKRNASVVIIDSLNGYLNAMPSEQSLLMHIRELLSYLSRHGVLTILIVSQYGLLGQAMHTPLDITYLADTVIVLRYFEASGEVKQAISVTKKRKGNHERTIREFRFGSHGIRIGQPLREFRGVLTGVPEFTGNEREILEREG